MCIKGMGVSQGIGIGRAYVLKDEVFDTSKRFANSNTELIRFSNALNQLIETLEEKVEEASGEQSDILTGHIDILNDPSLISDIEKRIISENCNSEYALATVFEQFAQMFLSSGDELLELRASDLRDIKNNLLTTLSGKSLFDIGQLPVGTIIVAEELKTSIAVGINPKVIKGIVTKLGGKTSHMAIISRSIGIPAIVGVPVEQIEAGTVLIADGDMGMLLVNPSFEQLEEYEAKQKALEVSKLALEKFRGMESVTVDGRKIELCANVGLVTDIDNALKWDAEGIGLFRTEFLYMNRNSAPSEEEQFRLYKKAAIAFKDKPVIIRTLDIGGDKEIPYLELEKEENPFLGWRAIRYCLDKKEIFTTQIRAILRASAFGQIKIMIPMISTLEEIKEAKILINTIKSELINEAAVACDNEIPVGIMVETPAAAMLADIFAKEVDFFSIGTNDLIQYAMAADRGNELVAGLYSPYQPAVMRLIYQVVQAAKDNGIMCGVCGEAGSDPLFMKYLIGIGINELSMPGVKILWARDMILKSSHEQLKEKIKEKIYKLSDVNDSIDFLKTL